MTARHIAISLDTTTTSTITMRGLRPVKPRIGSAFQSGYAPAVRFSAYKGPLSMPQQHACISSSSQLPVDARIQTRRDPGLAKSAEVGNKRFSDFDLTGKAFIVTGGARGLGLALAEALVEAGGKVYCLDGVDKPDSQWEEALGRVKAEFGGSLTYCHQDVKDIKHLEQLMGDIAEENGRLDGVIAAAGVQRIGSATEYSQEDADEMLSTNFTGAFMAASIAARLMFRLKCHGSICLVASTSGTVADKGLLSPVYGSSKAALIQLARNLAMEWSPVHADGSGGIRVNCISPGHVLTPVVRKSLEAVPGLEAEWRRENMMGRLAETSEFKGAALFLLSNASSFMTGSNLIIDGGHTAW